MGVGSYITGYALLGLFTRWGSLGIQGKAYSYRPWVTTAFAVGGSFAGYSIYHMHQRNLAMFSERLEIARARQDIEIATARRRQLEAAAA